MSEIITHLADITPKWLTDRLRAQGYLPHGEVREIHETKREKTTTSLTAQLHVVYSADATNTAPERLFLKIAKPELPAEVLAIVGKRKVSFYNAIRGTKIAHLVPRCYDAAYAEESGQFQLLLEDVSEMHYQTEWPLPPDLSACEQAIDCLATLHAHWWNRPFWMQQQRQKKPLRRRYYRPFPM